MKGTTNTITETRVKTNNLKKIPLRRSKLGRIIVVFKKHDNLSKKYSRIG